MIYRQLPPENCDGQRRYEPLPVPPRWQRVAVVVLAASLVAAALISALVLLVMLS